MPRAAFACVCALLAAAGCRPAPDASRPPTPDADAATTALPTPEIVRRGGAVTLLAEGDAVWWTPPGGGRLTRTAPGVPDEGVPDLDVTLLVKAPGEYLFASRDAVGAFARGKPARWLARALRLPGDLVLEGDRACWTAGDDPSNATVRARWCAPLAGGAPVRLGPYAAPARPAIEGSSGGVRLEHDQLVRPDGSALFTPIAPVRCAVVDGDMVWFAIGVHEPGDWFGHGPMHGTLYRVPAAGGTPTKVAEGFGQCLSIHAGRDAIWMGSYGGLLRVARRAPI